MDKTRLFVSLIIILFFFLAILAISKSRNLPPPQSPAPEEQEVNQSIVPIQDVQPGQDKG